MGYPVEVRDAAKGQDYRFLKGLRLRREDVPSFKAYPFNLPVVRNLTSLEFHPAVTYFVGENGTGKSTLLEAIAITAGFNPEGGTKNFNFSTYNTHSSLVDHLELGHGLIRERDGFFLRAESFYNVASELDKLDDGYVPPPSKRELQLEQSLQSLYEMLEENEDLGLVGNDEMRHIKELLNPPDLSPGPGSYRQSYGGSLHEKSHGEAFLNLIKHRFGFDSLFILDEPEAALSPARQLAALLRIHELATVQNCQFIIATHSPILMAYPDSKMYFLDADGIREATWKETEHYTLTKSFLDRPEAFLHHLLGS
ncbi:MAG TPA: AAA family ATPase [Fimbriimonadaceae bacterium]|nr:AAA family ATPase [Fimbriimonadaceae bacterium]